jgi:hypothetical protein
MNRGTVISAFALIMFATGICQADSLVIAYRSGKTQTVVLDEPSAGIKSWQYVGGSAPQQHSKKTEEAASPSVQEQIQKEQAKDDKRPPEKAPDKKSGPRFIWNAKPISE